MPCDLNLTPLQYEACLLYYGHGMRLMDIASVQGCGWRRVQRRLRVARTKYPQLQRQYHRRDFNPFA